MFKIEENWERDREKERESEKDIKRKLYTYIFFN